MKTLILAALLATTAHADFNTDAKEGPITCRSSHGMKISINGERDEIKLWSSDASGPLSPKTFAVVKRDSDGDSYVSYDAEDGQLTLSFDDRGDTVTFKGSNRAIPVRCR